MEYSFDEDVEISEIRLVFDNDMNRKYYNMPCNYPLVQTQFKFPETLIKEYRVEGETSDGERVSLSVGDNYQRFVRHLVKWKVKTVRFVPLATRGADAFRLFEFEIR